MTTVEVFHAAAALLGEGARWDAARDALVWVDIEGRRVHVTDGDGGATRAYAVPAPVGVAVPHAGGGLLLALGTGFATLALGGAADGALAAIATAPGADPARVRMNDGDVDPAGRLWAGTMAYDETPRAALYRLDADGTVATALAGVTVSNGLAWSRDGATLYYVDTPTRTIARFPFDAATGTLGPRAVHADTGGLAGVPDGMTADADGNLWVAFWDGWCVRCFAGADGALLDEIRLPVARPTSCAFGGDGLRRLHVTTARTGLDAGALADQPLAGSVLAVEPGVAGVAGRRARPPAA